MDRNGAQQLIDLNKRFYSSLHDSFSKSRQGSWPGWERVVASFPETERLHLLDLACGNLRFERFCTDRCPDIDFSFTCLDSTPEFVSPLPYARFGEIDALSDPDSLTRFGTFDVSVSFGFFHHIPTAALRRKLLDSLFEATKPGGVAALSFWRFAEDDALRQKAEATTRHAPQSLRSILEEGDYLLGWDGKTDTLRFCHSYTDRELDSLADYASSKADLIDRYTADGRTGAMNGYLIFRLR